MGNVVSGTYPLTQASHRYFPNAHSSLQGNHPLLRPAIERNLLPGLRTGSAGKEAVGSHYLGLKSSRHDSINDGLASITQRHTDRSRRTRCCTGRLSRVLAPFWQGSKRYHAGARRQTSRGQHIHRDLLFALSALCYLMMCAGVFLFGDVSIPQQKGIYLFKGLNSGDDGDVLRSYSAGRQDP